MTDLRKWSENAFVMLAGLKEAVQWELAPEIMKEIKELVDAYPVSAALSPARSGEPPAPQLEIMPNVAKYDWCGTVQSTDAAPQTSAEQIIIAKGLGVIVPLDRYNELIDAQRQIECLKNPPPALLQVVSKYLEHGLTVSHAESAVILCDLLSKFAEAKYVQPAAPQPVSGDAPHKIKVGKYPPMSAQEKLNHAAELYADLAQREGSEQDRDAAAMLQELAGAAQPGDDKPEGK